MPIFTARKRSLEQGNIFTPVCHSVHRGYLPPAGLHLGGLPTGRLPTRVYASRGVCLQGVGQTAPWVCLRGGGELGRPSSELEKRAYASHWNAFLFLKLNSFVLLQILKHDLPFYHNDTFYRKVHIEIRRSVHYVYSATKKEIRGAETFANYN